MRLHPKVVLTKNSPNQSERTGPIDLIVIHDTESDNMDGVVSWLCDPASSASCTVVVDQKGYSARLVPDSKKAWHCMNYNSYALGIEQCGYSTLGKLNWLKRRKELNETARWIAEWSIKYGIPIRRAHTNKNSLDHTPGVVTHKQLGQLGGGHNDPGKYPFDKVLEKARVYKRKLEKKK